MNLGNINLQRNIIALNKYLVNSNIEKSITQQLEVIIKELDFLLSKENKSSRPELVNSLVTKTNILLGNLKLYESMDFHNTENKTESIIKAIYISINEINQLLDPSNEKFQIEEKFINANDIILNNLRLSKEFECNYADLEDKIKILDKLATDKISEIDTTFQSKIKELKEQLGEVESSIAKKALSASFINRADKLGKESKLWLLASFIFISLFIGLAAWNFYHFPKISELNSESLDLHIRAYIIYSPICISLFWAIWFCTKKYTHLCHLRDEYNYKHDLSESFIGYKNEVTFLDNLSNNDVKLFPILLSAVIQNICKSPLETNKEECHSPWSEIVSLVCKGKDKIDKV